MTSELRVLLEKRVRLTDALRQRGRDSAYVFWYEQDGEVRPVGTFYKAWTTACSKAGLEMMQRPLRKNGEVVRYKRGPKKGLPIMVSRTNAWFHDFRRTAVRNLERDGVPRSVAKLMVGHKTDSVYERYNVASKRDLDVAREKMEQSAMNRLYAVGSRAPIGDGQSLGKVGADSTPSNVQTDSNLLESQNGPVAQMDRAAVS